MDEDEGRRRFNVIREARARLANPPSPYVERDEPLPSASRSFDPHADLSPLFDWSMICAEIDEHVAMKVAAERARIDERIAAERVYMADVIDEALEQYDQDVDDKIATAVTAARAEAHEAHQKELDAERVRHQNELLQFRTVLNDLTVAISRLTANEQTRAAAVLDLPALPRRDRSGMN